MANQTATQALDSIESFFGGNPSLTRGEKEPGDVGGSGLEPGLDFGLPQGSAVRTPFAGVFRQDLSTSQEQVVQFTTASGKVAYEAFTHVNALPGLRVDPYLSAGQEVGTVAAPGYTPPSAATKGITYYTTGPSIEYAVGENITSPAQLVDYYHTEDIGSLIAGTATGTASGATQSGPISPSGPSGPLGDGTVTIPNTQTGSDTGFNPPQIFGKGGLIDPSSWISGNLPTNAGIIALVFFVLILVIVIKR